ncbi:response regulator transcription factor [Spiractinospora alimapuensis]|uniref:response regulator transcription factor n=1 Tax=Spiractinospora alimapuensis TaxID=2820884 RepID=UPI001F2AD84F|nr:response regulator transcription factor [Spiractinospora alimapuensis]QVQ53789.1 response regulator transcription factor [Spiractinospora alimapuensis]
MTSVVLADDEVLLRSAMASLLPLEGDVTVLGEAHDGESAIRETLRHRPDVLVIDLEMPGVDGLGAVAAIRRELPDQVILMLTRHARPGVLRKALKLGVQGFVSKSADPGHITTVIATLHSGKRWIDPDVSALAIIDDCPLTDREIDVLRVTRDGYSVADIAAQLHLAEGTVRNYLSSAMTKTGSRTRHEAARYAHEHDWL